VIGLSFFSEFLEFLDLPLRDFVSFPARLSCPLSSAGKSHSVFIHPPTSAGADHHRNAGDTSS